MYTYRKRDNGYERARRRLLYHAVQILYECEEDLHEGYREIMYDAFETLVMLAQRNPNEVARMALLRKDRRAWSTMAGAPDAPCVWRQPP